MSKLKFNRISILLLVILSLGLIGCDKIDEITDGDNREPIIDRLEALRRTLAPNDTTTIIVEAHDPDNEELTYQWRGEGTFLTSSGDHVIWRAPDLGGDANISVKVEDGSGGEAERSLTLSILASEDPVVNIIRPGDDGYFPGVGEITIEATATHPNGIRGVEFLITYQNSQTDSLYDNSAPYIYNWNIDDKSGSALIRVEAEATLSDAKGVNAISINIEGVVPVDGGLK